MSGIVHEYIDPAESGYRLPHQFAAMAGVGDVAGNDNTLAAGTFHKVPRLRGVLVLIEIGDQNVGSLPREGESDGAANHGIRPGNQSNLILQSAGATITILAVIGRRIHRIAGAGRLLVLRFKWRPGELIIHIRNPDRTWWRLDPDRPANAPGGHHRYNH